MERTNQELKDELLRVYRIHFATVQELDRVKSRLVVAKRKAKEAEERADLLADDATALREDHSQLWDNYDHMVEENFLQSVALYECLDLVGAVIEDEAASDVVDRILKDEAPLAKCMCSVAHPGTPCQSARIEQPSVGIRYDGAPLRCLSCNEDKEEDFYYLCERCFNLDNDYDLNLIGDLMRDWDAGHRDFPRAGKNAKELTNA